MAKKVTATTDSRQYESFVHAAREIGTDESEEAFDRALKKVAAAKPSPIHKDGKNRPKAKD